LSEPTRAELLRIIALLEQHHGVGVRGDELPGWLEERLREAVRVLLRALRLAPSALPSRLEAEPALMIELANALRVGETRFYRDAAQWEALRRGVLPGLFARRNEAQPVLALSAGCSTGEEAWTLAMLLSESPRRARARVLGVDRSETALVTARAAVYDAGSQQRLPAELAQRFLLPAVDGSVRVVPELRSMVTFQCRDLTRGPPPGRYAIIVCKNVLIYFGEEAQDELVTHLLRALTDDGTLLVARSEVPIVRSLGAHAHEIGPGITAFRAH
jgi:chemotaxis protein methyltransferase CheR